MSVADALLMASTAGETLDEAIMRLKAPGKGIGDVGSALEELDARLNGLGEVLAPLLRLPGITDILVNSTRVWVDCGQGVEPIDDGFSSEEEVRALAITMAAICGKRLDDAVPIVDGILPMGVRVHAVIPPLSGEGTIISLRIPARGGLTLEQMRKGASIDDTTQQILSRMLEVRCNVLISGATGSGKTTLLSALLSSISVNERLICIEEISELHPAHPHVVHLQARQANTQGRGEVSLSELVRAAMRMRPDRIILGECRGGEVRDIMSALNTGHRGSFATIHANTPAEVPARLSALGALKPPTCRPMRLLTLSYTWKGAWEVMGILADALPKLGFSGSSAGSSPVLARTALIAEAAVRPVLLGKNCVAYSVGIRNASAAVHSRSSLGSAPCGESRALASFGKKERGRPKDIH